VNWQKEAAMATQNIPDPVALLASPAVEAAFAALRTYGAGSSRALLMPIDAAVAACVPNPAARKLVEEKLVAVLKFGCSTVAGTYCCSQLRLAGSERCIAAVEPFLMDPEMQAAARDTLEALPGKAPGKALMKSLDQVLGKPGREGSLAVGLINSLGVRREEASVAKLSALLRDKDEEVVSASAAALGKIGSPRAGKALGAWFEKCPSTQAEKGADALLTCIGSLRSSGDRRRAESLRAILLSRPVPPQVQKAAAALAG
jgi:hypothetical protein